MISEDVDHGSRGLFPRASIPGRFLVILLFGGLFDPNFAIIRGVHAPHEVMLKQTEGLALSAKPRVLIFREGSD